MWTIILCVYLQSAEAYFDAIAVSSLELGEKLEDVAGVGTSETISTMLVTHHH